MAWSRSLSVLAVLLFVIPGIQPMLQDALADSVTAIRTDAEVIAAAFPLDKSQKLTTGNPVDDASAGYHNMSSGSGALAKTITVLSVGGYREGSDPAANYKTPFAFQTTLPNEMSVITNGQLAAPGAADQSAAYVLVLCRELLSATHAYTPCSDMSLTGNMRVERYASKAHVNRAETEPIPPATAPAWGVGYNANIATDARLFDPSIANVQTTTSAIIAPVTTGTVQSVSLIPIGSDATLFALKFSRASGLDSYPESVEIFDGTLTQAGGGSMKFREPVWRTSSTSGPESLLWCGLPYDSTAAATTATKASWSSTCSTINGGVVSTTWSKVLASPITKDKLARSFADESMASFAAFVTSATNTHLASMGPGGCRGCPSAVPLTMSGGFDPIPTYVEGSLMVRDGPPSDPASWVRANAPSHAYGGSMRFQVKLVNPLLGFAGLPLHTDGSFLGDVLLTIEIDPDAPTASSVGVEVGRPSDPVVDGATLDVPFVNTPAALPVTTGSALRPAVPSDISLVSAIGGDSSPFLTYWRSPVGQPISSCFQEVYSHSESGVNPNFGDPASRLAASGNAPSCSLISVTDKLALQGISAGAILEIRKGPDFAIEIETPHLSAQDAAAAWSRGEDTRADWRAPLALVQDARINLGGDVYKERAAREHLSVPRIVVTLDDSLTSPELSDAALLAAMAFQDDASSVAIEIDDLPTTSNTDHLLSLLDQRASKLHKAELPIIIGAGVLPDSAWTRPLLDKLMTIQGLAALPRVITIGSGDEQRGIDAWSRQGPAPDMTPKPDFLAPAPVGSTAMSVANIVPFLELAQLGGLQGDLLVRGALAGVALPVNSGAVPLSFYQTGFGALDAVKFADAFAPLGTPSLAGAKSLALTALEATRLKQPNPGVRALQNMPEPRQPFSTSAIPFDHTVSDGTTIWLIGGDSTGPATIRSYDPRSDTYGTIDPLGTSTSSVRAAAWTPFGIFIAMPGAISKYDPTTRTISPTVWTIPSTGIQTLTWTGSSLIWAANELGSSGDLTHILQFDPISGNQVGEAYAPYWSNGIANWIGTKLLFGSYFTGASHGPAWTFDPKTNKATALSCIIPEAQAIVWDGRTVFVVQRQIGYAQPLTVSSFDAQNCNLVQVSPTQIMTSDASAVLGPDAIYAFGASAPGATAVKAIAIMPTGLRVIGPRTAHGALANSVNAATNVEDIAGLSLPPGVFDTKQFGRTFAIDADPPAFPMTPITDWGLIDHTKVATVPFGIIDVQAILHGQLLGFRNRTASAAQGAQAVDPLIANVPTDAELHIRPRHEVDITTDHYRLFQFFTTDYLLGLQASLTDPILDQGLNGGRDVIENITNVTLPDPHHMIHDAHLNASPSLPDPGQGPCVAIGSIAQFTTTLSAFLQTEKALVTTSTTSGLMRGDVNPTASVAAFLASGPRVSAPASLCSNSDFANASASLEGLRSDVRMLKAATQTLLQPTDGMPTLYPLDAAQTASLLANSSPRISVHPSDDLNATVADLEAEIDSAERSLQDATLRIPTAAAGVAIVGVSLSTNSSRTLDDDLGPYVGLTKVTTHNVTIRHPFTGEILAQHNVTIPVPSLLWNNPLDAIRQQVTDGSPVIDTSLWLEIKEPKVFKSLSAGGNVTVDNLTVPLFENIDRLLAIEQQGVDLPASTPIDDIIAQLHLSADRDPSSADLASQRDILASRAALAALALVPHVATGAQGTLVGEQSLETLFPFGKTMENISDSAGWLTFGRMFPNEGPFKEHPIMYSSAVNRSLQLPYTGLSAANPGSLLHDVDRTVERLVRTSVVGEDSTPKPTDPPRWAHLPDPARSPSVQGSPYVDPYEIMEVHDDVLDHSFNQFGLSLYGDIDLDGLVCTELYDRARDLGTPLSVPGACGTPLTLPSDLTPFLCASAETQNTCIDGLDAARDAGRSRADQISACAMKLKDTASCDALLLAHDKLRELEAKKEQTRLKMPYIESIPTLLRRHADALGLTPEALSARIVAVNGLDPNNATDVSHALEVARKALDDLPKYVNLSVQITDPSRVDQVYITDARALKSHATDRVSGYDYSFVAPPRLDDLTSRTLDLLAQAVPLLNDPASRAWASQQLATLNAMPSATINAALHAPDTSEIRSRQGSWDAPADPESRDGGPFPTTGTPPRPWMSDANVGIAALPPDAPVEQTVGVAPIALDLLEREGITIGTFPLGLSFPSLESPEASTTPCSKNEAAKQLHSAWEQNESALNTARMVATALQDALFWKISCGEDEIRAASSTMLPKIGAFSYTVPLAPQETFQADIDGEYYFQNSAAILVATPRDEVRDALMAAAWAANGNAVVPNAEALADVVKTAVSSVGASADHKDDYVRVRILGPQTRIESSSNVRVASTNASGARDDAMILRLGALRVQDGSDSFEFNTKGVYEGQFGFDEMHFIWLFLPVVDAQTIGEVQNWTTKVDPQMSASNISALYNQTITKFIISNFTVALRTYVGYVPGPLPIKAPWNPNVEDVKVLFDVPADAYVQGDLQWRIDGVDGVHYTRDDLAFAEIDPWMPDPGARGWLWQCGDEWGSGSWYAPGTGGPTRAGAAGPPDPWARSRSCDCAGDTQLDATADRDWEGPNTDPVDHSRRALHTCPGAVDPNATSSASPEDWANEMAIPYDDAGTLDQAALDKPWGSMPMLAPIAAPKLDPNAAGSSLIPTRLPARAYVPPPVATLTGVAGGLLSALADRLKFQPGPLDIPGPSVTYWAVIDQDQIANLTKGSSDRPYLTPTEAYTSTVKPYYPAPYHTFRQTESWMDKSPWTPGTVPLTTPFDVLQKARAPAVNPLDADWNGIDDSLEAVAQSGSSGQRVQVLVTFKSVDEAHTKVQAILDAGASIERIYDGLPVLLVDVAPPQLPALFAMAGATAFESDIALSATGMLAPATINVVSDATLPPPNITMTRPTRDVQVDVPNSSMSLPAPDVRSLPTGPAGSASTYPPPRVAILDTGIAASAPTFAGKDIIWKDLFATQSTPVDQTGHGTAVASLVAGAPAGSFSGGVAPQAPLAVIRIMDSSGNTDAVHLLDGLEWVYDHHDEYDIKVVLISAAPNYDTFGDDGTTSLDAAVDALSSAGILVVVPAGNGNGYVSSPAAAKTAATIGAIDNNNAPFNSRHGPTRDGRLKPDLVAPGKLITAASMSPSGGTTSVSGTSFAAAQAAGAATLTFAALGARATPADVLQRLTQTAAPVGPVDHNHPDQQMGYGRVDVVAATSAPATRDSYDLRVTVPMHEGMFEAGHATVFQVVVQNIGQLVISTGTVTAQADGVTFATASIPSLFPGATATIDLTWNVPDVHRTVLLSVSGDLGGPPEWLGNNVWASSVMLSRLTPAPPAQWTRPTAPMDPCRVCVVLVGQAKTGIGAGTHAFDVAVMDGFTGTGYALGESASETGTGEEADSRYSSLGTAVMPRSSQLGLADGGTPYFTDDGHGYRLRPTPPQDCWSLPAATEMDSNSMCWKGHWITSVAGAAISQVPTDPCAVAGTALNAKIGAIFDAQTQRDGSAPWYAQGALRSLSGVSPPPPGDSDLLRYMTFSALDVLPQVASLMGCAGATIPQGAPHNVAPAGCEAGALNGAAPCADVIVGDLVESYPIQPVAHYFPVGLPVSPQPAQGFSVVQGPAVHQITLQWATPIGAIHGYRVYRGESAANLQPLADLDLSSTTYLDTTGTLRHRYYYAIATLTTNGEGARTSVLSTVVPDVPDSPTLTIGALDVVPRTAPTTTCPTGQVSCGWDASLSWTLPPPVDGLPLTHIIISQSPRPSSESPVAPQPPTTTNYRIVTKECKPTFTVATQNQFGISVPASFTPDQRDVTCK